jgi:uncharacterized membrane protein
LWYVSSNLKRDDSIKTISHTCESMTFLLMGVTMISSESFWDFKFVFVVLGVITISRAIGKSEFMKISKSTFRGHYSMLYIKSI